MITSYNSKHKFTYIQVRKSQIVFKIIMWKKPCKMFGKEIWMIDKYKVINNLYKKSSDYYYPIFNVTMGG